MVLFVDYLQSRSVGEGAKSIYQRFKKVIRYAIEHDVILKDLTYKNVDYSNKLLKFEQNKTKGHSSASGVVIPLNVWSLLLVNLLRMATKMCLYLIYHPMKAAVNQ